MLEIYIEALLVNEELADEVWELWNRGVFDDELAVVAWARYTNYMQIEIEPFPLVA